MNGSAAISARNVDMVYTEGPVAVHALKSVSIDIAEGEIVLMMGPSGSGKTTLLSIVGGLLTPTSGNVSVKGRNLPHLNRRERALFRLSTIGFIFQGFNLFGALSARENVELALNAKGIKGREARARSTDLLGRLGLHAEIDRLARDLSGGEKQRVAIARALATEPAILLADEPTSSLDAANGAHVIELLSALTRERGVTVLIVSHDSRIGRIADRVVELDDGHF